MQYIDLALVLSHSKIIPAIVPSAEFRESLEIFIDLKMGGDAAFPVLRPDLFLLFVEERLDVITFPPSFSFLLCYLGSSPLPSSMSRWQEGNGNLIMQTGHNITAKKYFFNAFNLNNIFLLYLLCSCHGTSCYFTINDHCYIIIYNIYLHLGLPEFETRSFQSANSCFPLFFFVFF